MPPSDKAGRVVFIGNIPYGGTEELIIETLGRVGKVNNFRLVYDKETGRPKGFGFAEFEDADAAASAVRNLNDYDLMGRKLRVDWSNDNGSGDNAPSAQPPHATMNGQAPEQAQAQQASTLGPLPPGVALPPNLTCPDAISRTLSTLPPEQLLDILSQMKGLVMTDPAKATELLRQAPQLAYAIFQSLLLLQLVDPQILGSIVESQPAAPAPVAQLPPVQQQPPPARPPMNYPVYPPQAAPTPQPQPPVPQPYAQPPAPQPYAQAPPAQPAPVAMDQQALYAQVMALTPQQIDQLTPEYRAQIMQIRQMLMAGGRP